jgi:hypothetical protein
VLKELKISKFDKAITLRNGSESAEIITKQTDKIMKKY